MQQSFSASSTSSVSGLRRYHHVWIWHSQCRSPAGDADESLARILKHQHALRRDPQWGWLGIIDQWREGQGPPGIAELHSAQENGASEAGHPCPGPWASRHGNIDPEHQLAQLAQRAADPCYAAAMQHQPLNDQQPPQLWPAIIASASKGDTAAWSQGQPQLLLSRGLPGQLSACLARRWGRRFFRGHDPVGACATGLLAVLGAADEVAAGRCPWAVAGAADASLQPLLLGGFRSLGVSCGDQLPQAHGPSDQGRGGFAPAEGAGFVALGPEPRDPQDWQLCGGMRLGDASHETRCDDPRVLRQLFEGLWQCCPEPDIIVCHGTGTRSGDALEMAALESGPWRSAQRLCCKPIIGHSLGANAAVELAIGLHGPWRRLWKISLGFGGHIAGLAAQRPGSRNEARDGAQGN